MKHIPFLFFLTCLGLVACSSETPQENETFYISSEALINADLPAEEKAESLVKAAEKLLLARAEFEAYELAKEARQLDPNNLRAQYLFHKYRTFEVAKGIFARIAPLAALNEKTKTKLEQRITESQIENSANFHAFLMEGKGDIDSVEKLQALFDQYIQYSVDEIQFIQSIKDKEIKFKTSRPLTIDNSDRLSMEAYEYGQQCTVTKKVNKEFEISCPPNSTRRELIFNRADFDALLQTKVMIFAYLAIVNTYSAEGTMEFLISKSIRAEDEVAQPKQLSSSELLESFKKDPQFGKLRTSKWFGMIREMVGQIISGIIFLRDNQSESCKINSQTFERRPGHYMSYAFCFNSPYGWSTEAVLNGLETALKGSHSLVSYHKTKGEKQHVVDEMKFFEQPVNDLRQLGKIQFNVCGDIIGMENNTFNGVFPNGDVNEVLPYSVGVCELEQK